MISDKTKRTKELLIVLLVFGSFILFAQFFVRPLPQQGHLSCYNCIGKPKIEYILRNLVTQAEIDFQVNCFNSTLNISKLSNQNMEAITKNQTVLCLPADETNVSKCIKQWSDVFVKQPLFENSSFPQFMNLTSFLVTGENIHCVKHKLPNLKNYGGPTENVDLAFWAMLILVALSAFSIRGCEPIIDATIVGALGEEKEWKFGRIILPDLTEESIGAYAAATTNISFIPMYACTALAWFCAAYVTCKSNITSEISTTVKLADIKTVFKNANFIIFVLLGLLILYGFAQGVLGGYVFWFAEVKLNAPTVVLGLSTLAGCISDIPALFFSGHVIRRIGSPAIFIITMILFAVRFYLYCLLTQAWMIIPIDMFRAVTFGLMWPAICTYAGSISPPELQATTMAIVHVASWNFGKSRKNGVNFEVYVRCELLGYRPLFKCSYQCFF
ncbi:unnamed protein product [Clavelina lepadiformis]|uniref:Major facilitator superfamily (MFS) profile domain-containing protein n=1 Tax=Clavelina lepadiformis TaxID=159417 RepID=A0ABP0GHW5_CLALP